jgi:hypothetical protein
VHPFYRDRLMAGQNLLWKNQTNCFLHDEQVIVVSWQSFL